jgi:hypothetical protein
MTPHAEISVLLPTRGRPARAERMLRSLTETAAEPGAIEVVLLVDQDDTPSHAIDTADLATKRLIGRRSSMGVMTDVCYRASSGRHIMLANDDIVFRTPGWDALVLECLDRYADGVALVWGYDDFTGGPTHPFLSRQLCELMGGVCPTAFDRLFIDVHLYSIFRKLERVGHDRLHFLADVLIEHVHADADKHVSDDTYVKSHARSDEILYIHYETERQYIAKALCRHIESSSAGASRHAPMKPMSARRPRAA